MTDISKEAVERHAKWIADNARSDRTREICATLRALSARVQELENDRDAKDEEIETLRSGLETAEDIRTTAYKRGRLQGLDEAAEYVRHLSVGHATAIEQLKQEQGQ